VRRAARRGPASAAACCCSCSPRPRGAARPRRAAQSATSRTGAGCGGDARAPEARLKLEQGTRTELGGQLAIKWLALQAMQVFLNVLRPCMHVRGVCLSLRQCKCSAALAMCPCTQPQWKAHSHLPNNLYSAGDRSAVCSQSQNEARVRSDFAIATRRRTHGTFVPQNTQSAEGNERAWS